MNINISEAMVTALFQPLVPPGIKSRASYDIESDELLFTMASVDRYAIVRIDPRDLRLSINDFAAKYRPKVAECLKTLPP